MITLYRYTNKNPQQGAVQLSVNGNLTTLDELTRQLPAGVYTTFRTFHKLKILNLDMHIDRLERSAELKSRPLSIDRRAFRAHLRSALETHPAQENRVRVIVAWNNKPESEVIYLAVEELRVPEKILYIHGAKAKTVSLKRDNPQAKATDFIQQTSRLRAEINNGLNELLMVAADGVILEGLSSNFFAIRQDAVYTNPVGVLPGITRELVLDILHKIEMTVILEGIHLAEIGELQEAFITSASRGVLPIVQIDETVIGSGAPGPNTMLLIEAYQRSVEERIKEI